MYSSSITDLISKTDFVWVNKFPANTISKRKLQEQLITQTLCPKMREIYQQDLSQGQDSSPDSALPIT